MRRHLGLYEWVAIVAAAVVAGAAIAQAIREQSLEPIVLVAWLPAVLVASLSRPQSARHCWRRLTRRSAP
jgi:hypothetical protein